MYFNGKKAKDELYYSGEKFIKSVTNLKVKVNNPSNTTEGYVRPIYNGYDSNAISYRPSNSDEIFDVIQSFKINESLFYLIKGKFEAVQADGVYKAAYEYGLVMAENTAIIGGGS